VGWEKREQVIVIAGGVSENCTYIEEISVGRHDRLLPSECRERVAS